MKSDEYLPEGNYDLRKRAEDRVKMKAEYLNEFASSMTIDEAKKILYEDKVRNMEMEIQNEELRMLNPDGTNFWVRMRTVGEKDPDGETAVHDAKFVNTSQKEVQTVSNASEDKYRMIIEDVSDVIWIYNLKQKRYTFISPSVHRLLGYAPEEVLARSMEDCMIPESYKILSEQFSNTLGHFIMNPQTPQSYVNVIQQPCRNGEIIWVEVSTTYRYNLHLEIEVLGLSRNISVRKSAEEQLAKESEQLRNMMVFLSEGVIMTDELGKITFINPMAERIFGFQKDEVLGLDYSKLLYMMDRVTKAKEPDPVSYVLETGKPVSSAHVLDFVRKDGFESSFTYTAAPILSAGGTVKGVVVTNRELTKENERDKEIDGFLSTIMELRCVTDPGGYFRRINGKFEEILGYRAAEVENKNILTFLHQEEIQKACGTIINVQNNDSVVSFTCRFRCKDGSYKFIEWYTIFDKDKSAYSSGRDVTDRQKQEDMLNEMDTFFNSSPDLLSVSKTDGCLLKINNAWEKVLGYSKAELVGNYFSQFESPDTISYGQTNNRHLVTPGQGVTFVDRFRHKNGSYLNIEWRAHCEGDLIYSIGRDVTERMEYEKQIKFSSYHDVLTGLFNRRFLEEEINRMDTARSLPISIIMGDINRLKLVNDAFGHEKGDELIVKAAESIKASCRPEDLVARWGGDEFLIFLSKTGTAEAEKIVERILLNCEDKQVNSIPVSISFGIYTKTCASEAISGIMRKAEEDMYKAKARESERERKDIIDTIAHTLYKNNPYEEMHAKRVSALCAKTAQELGFEHDAVQKLTHAGLLHDIGKVAVSSDILEKPSQLTEEEWIEVRQHPEIGYKVVGSSQEMIEIGNAIRAHHERMDGKGYPKGLQSEDIPEAARIIAIADSYDTMTGQSLYRDTITLEEAIAEIRRNEGTQFDPEIAEVFINNVLLGLHETLTIYRYCPYCGSQIDAAVNYCWNCGHLQPKPDPTVKDV